ncbi:DUF2786 domain-containing protein [Actinomycetes bacterium M1A6_2h]
MDYASGRLDDKLRRVAKLLAQADSVAGTPEADAFNDRAFALMAQYEISETDARASRANNGTPSLPIQKDIVLSGRQAYPNMRLLIRIAAAVHCSSVYEDRSGPPRTVVVTIFGTQNNIKKAIFLFQALESQMLTAASRDHQESGRQLSFRKFIRHYSVGFGNRILARIQEAEESAMRTHSSNPNAASLVLLSDAEKARDAVQAAFPDAVSQSYNVKNGLLIDTALKGDEAGSRAHIPSENVLS